MERFPRDVAVQRGSAAIEALSEDAGRQPRLLGGARGRDDGLRELAAALGVAPPLLMKQEQAQADPAYALWLAGKVQLMTRRRLVEAGAGRCSRMSPCSARAASRRTRAAPGLPAVRRRRQPRAQDGRARRAGR